MLRQLVDFAARIPAAAVTPASYQNRAVKYDLELTREGRLRGIVPTIATDSKRGVDRAVPDAVRTSGVRSLLLIDKASYVLGYRAPDTEPGREAAEHQAFVALVEECAASTEEPTVQAVLRFLTDLTPDATEELLRRLPDFDPEGRIRFLVDGQSPVEATSVQEFWAERCAPPPDGPLFECLVCGKRRPQVGVHPYPIKPIPGGQTSGNYLVSNNAGAFESFGLSRNEVAPTCRPCAEAYGKALNYLLSNPRTRLFTKSSAYVFWTRDLEGFAVGPLLNDPDPEEVEELFKSSFTGREAATDIDTDAFYALGLSASGSRVVVRTWIDTTVGEAKHHLRHYFLAQRLVDWDGTPGGPLPLFRLTGGTVRNPRRDAPEEIVEKSLIRFAIAGTQLPDDLLFLAVQRNRAMQKVTRERAVLIKLVLFGQRLTEGEEDVMAQLNVDHQNEAYHYGRLLAVLDSIQRNALGNPKASLVDRFYGTASTAPATVFSTMLSTTRAHLTKMRKEKPGLYRLLDDQLMSVTDRVGEFKPTLPLKDQGLFALGFYHQRAEDRRQIAHRKALKAAGQLATVETAGEVVVIEDEVGE